MAQFFDRNCPGYLTDTQFTERDGILVADSSEGEAASIAYDRECESRGYKAPDPHTFRLLPRDGLPGWPTDYWRKRAASTATLWNILEERRRAKRLTPVDVVGVAADISPGLPYLAYGLDVGGYISIALSPHAGRYGLGAYPFSRYCRVQAELTQLPLKEAAFDVIIFSGSLAGVAPEALPGILQVARAALVRNGCIAITDTPETHIILSVLDDLSMKVEIRQAVEHPESWRDRLRQFRRGTLAAPPVITGIPR